MKTVCKCRGAYARRPAQWGLLVLLVIAAMASGCGDGANTYPVRGTVTYEGETLDRGSVLFNPVDAELPPARATIQSDGTYELRAAPGEYKIVVNLFTETDPELEPDDPDYEAPESLLPRKYSTLTRTPLQETVEDKEQNIIDLDL